MHKNNISPVNAVLIGFFILLFIINIESSMSRSSGNLRKPVYINNKDN